MHCAEALRAQAYFDGELDAPNALEVERHAEHCARCRTQLEDLDGMRIVLRRDLRYTNTPPAFRARIAHALDQGRITYVSVRAIKDMHSPRQASAAWRTQPFWNGAFAGIGGMAIAATTAFLFLAPPLMSPVLSDLTGAHMRSLMPSHLIDVVSTDKHTVKPWFAGHADVSPVVADYEAQGYKLVGGRADYFDHQRAAVVVYRHGEHVINVFSWGAGQATLPHDTARDGYQLAFWKTGDLAYCAVSDAGWHDLLVLAKLVQDSSAHDN
jgi:anti-sigma factor RsiW